MLAVNHVEGILTFTPSPKKLAEIKKIRKAIKDAGGNPDLVPAPENFGLSEQAWGDLFVNTLAEEYCYHTDATNKIEVNEYVEQEPMMWLQNDVQNAVDIAVRDGAVVNGRIFQVRDSGQVECVDVVDNKVTYTEGYLVLGMTRDSGAVTILN